MISDPPIKAGKPLIMRTSHRLHYFLVVALHCVYAISEDDWREVTNASRRNRTARGNDPMSIYGPPWYGARDTLGILDFIVENHRVGS